ncbi:MAG: hypothetical protein PWP58_379 [Bacillota bacterium]|nr:hypothetical protein [Bacillota bacterium]
MSKGKRSFLDAMSPEERVKFLHNFFTTGGTPPAAEQSARADLLVSLLEDADPDDRALKAWQDERLRHQQEAIKDAEE